MVGGSASVSFVALILLVKDIKHAAVVAPSKMLFWSLKSIKSQVAPVKNTGSTELSFSMCVQSNLTHHFIG